MRGIAALGLIALLSACSPKDADPPPAAQRGEPPVVAGGTKLNSVERSAAYEPPRSDPERKILLDLVRSKVDATLGVPVEFKVETLRVSGDWAFAVLEPMRPGGGPVSISETKLKDEEGEWDGLRTEAIWRKQNGAWVLTEHAIGATDVWYEPFCDTAPKGLIPICANRAPKP